MEYLQQALIELAQKYRSLEQENRQLRKQLKVNDMSLPVPIPSEPDTDPDQGARIQFPWITEYMVRFFFSMFWGRMDVYARRGKNGGWYPQCLYRWNASICPKHTNPKSPCSKCPHRGWEAINPKILLRHLLGSSNPIGIYPLHPDGTCRFLVFDFDAHSEASDPAQMRKEAETLRMICTQLGINCLVERSRSGKGSHVWIFFKEPVKASTARQFGMLLLNKGSQLVPLRSYQCYDRMFPAQDKTEDLGSLIALPLHGASLTEGNTAFVDEHWNAIPDQWQAMKECQKLTREQIELFIQTWGHQLALETGRLAMTSQYRPDPWKQSSEFHPEDVYGTLHITLADGIYVDALTLHPRLQNQIRNLAAMANPAWYENTRFGYSNWNTPRILYTGSDVDGYIRLPRGVLDTLKKRLESSGIDYWIRDKRQKGTRLRLDFQGALRPEQQTAQEELLKYDSGILSAATSFGKTVVAASLIAQRKVNTLILIEKTALLEQWQQELEQFLRFDVPLPEYQKKSGKIRKRKSHIGILKGPRNTMTGLVDIAMAQTLGSMDSIPDRYGMVIVDECHHAASPTFRKILDRISPAYLYGMTATPQRADKLDPLITMLIGDIRHTYSAMDKAKSQNLQRLLIPRFTRSLCLREEKPAIYELYEYIAQDPVRNELIAGDVRQALAEGHTCAIFVRLKSHAAALARHLEGSADHLFLVYGDNSEKENREQLSQLKRVPDSESVLIIATGQKIGEGFSYPRLDTLFLVSPIAFEGLLLQFLGRLNRDYPGKKAVQVYDYIDRRIPVFQGMYRKRLRTYKKAAWQLQTTDPAASQTVNAIFDLDNYLDAFLQDLRESRKEVVISSPAITLSRAEKVLQAMEGRNEVDVVIFTAADDGWDGTRDAAIHQLKKEGFSVRELDDPVDPFSVIDRELVWDGGINLLGPEDAWNHLIRVKDKVAAAELLEMVVESW